jgi:hypothetical protein
MSEPESLDRKYYFQPPTNHRLFCLKHGFAVPRDSDDIILSYCAFVTVPVFIAVHLYDMISMKTMSSVENRDLAGLRIRALDMNYKGDLVGVQYLFPIRGGKSFHSLAYREAPKKGRFSHIFNYKVYLHKYFIFAYRSRITFGAPTPASHLMLNLGGLLKISSTFPIHIYNNFNDKKITKRSSRGIELFNGFSPVLSGLRCYFSSPSVRFPIPFDYDTSMNA